MSEQIFRSPGFFEREVDLTQRSAKLEGIPAGVIGTSQYGPAFVPVTQGSYIDFERKFGTVGKDQYGPFAVREWLKNRTAATFIRVLGAGSGMMTSDGTVDNAGFIIKGRTADDGTLMGALAAEKRHVGSVQFIAALHDATTYEVAGYPVFTDNDSFDTSSNLKMIRSMILLASGARLQILDHDEAYSLSNVLNDDAGISSYNGAATEGTFKLVLSSALGSSFGNDEGFAGVKIFTASLNPSSDHYIGKFLNKNPDQFHEEQHLLYADFPVEHDLAKVKYVSGKSTIAVLSGSADANGVSGVINRDLFGRFDTRYTSAKTTSFISQPFGEKEYDLFHFEAIDDGEIGHKRVKVSISNLRRSTDPKNPYGTFTILVRDVNDSDTDLKVLEQFGPCTLNPADGNYVANLIGDYKVYFNFDGNTESERRLNVEGKRPNRSQFLRIVMNRNVEDKIIPAETLPFGFRGLPTIKTNDYLTDNTSALSMGSAGYRLAAVESTDVVAGTSLTGSIVPPIPMRFKSTRGAVNLSTSPTFTGEPGNLELADSRYFWGVKTENIPLESAITNAVLKANAGTIKSGIVEAYSKFLGIQSLDTLVTGSGADAFNNNKFSLSKVALYNQFALTSKISNENALSSIITGSVSDHMREAAYIRNGVVESKNYTITDDGTSSLQRLTFASLAAARDPKIFNRFSDYAKFTNIFYGGFDGVNILDRDQRTLNDRASSSESGGKATSEEISYLNLHPNSSPGLGNENNTVNSYRTAARIMTDPFASRVNIVCIPGIRDPYITDYVSEQVRNYSQAIYLMDIPSYDDNGNRIFSLAVRPSVRKTVDSFESRAIDNNYIATYFPDIIFNDDINNSTFSSPSSIAALKALGYNDSIAYPWYAPAGFNRGSLSNVLNSRVRLNTEDRNILYDARINPIANFPNGGFVIFGQKTLQQDSSALDRVNVRRMLLEVKRIVSDIASKLIFEQNTPQTRAKFVKEVTPELSRIQLQQGIDKFEVIMDSSNNSNEDIEQNKLNGKIILVPTRAVEFIAIDFIITNSGVSFE